MVTILCKPSRNTSKDSIILALEKGKSTKVISLRL